MHTCQLLLAGSYNNLSKNRILPTASYKSWAQQRLNPYSILMYMIMKIIKSILPSDVINTIIELFEFWTVGWLQWGQDFG